MAVNTGRTTFKFLTFSVDDSAGTLRQIPINSLSVVGVVYDEVEMFAWQDAVKGALVGMANCPIDIGGPYDTTASTGSHTVLSGINGLIPATYLSLNISIGIRQAYQAGEPTFGITGTAANGFLCFGYTVDFGTGQYTAHFNTAPASTLPAWGTAAYT